MPRGVGIREGQDDRGEIRTSLLVMLYLDSPDHNDSDFVSDRSQNRPACSDPVGLPRRRLQHGQVKRLIGVKARTTDALIDLEMIRALSFILA